ncbi:MAG: NADH-quinone oxidoreductase subunit L [Acidimicrobiaceae bacterium]|nr:NADH-quinone oxidoreductase subunit L [Acidimicrobiaceae bacterium]
MSPTVHIAGSLLAAAAESVGGSGPISVDDAGWFLNNAWLIPLLPTVSFATILLLGKRLPGKGAICGIIAVAGSLLLSCGAGVNWITHRDSVGSHDGVPAVHRSLEWLRSGGVDHDVGILLDGLSVMMLFVVSFISLLVHVYSTDYVSGDSRYTHFFAFLSLFTAAMLFFVVSDNLLQMIVGWELVGVCSFVLIGHWWEHRVNSNAALKAFLTNRVGDVGLLIGMTVLFFAAGNTFDTLTITKRIAAGEVGRTAVLVAAVCLTVAVMSKSGQFVLHTWLPDAMAGPTPVSALIHAATMVVAGIFMIARLYPVFWTGMSIEGSSINLLAVVGSVTLLFGGFLAFTQDDIKKVLAYSTVSQLGYMVMALGVGAWTAAIFHLFTHAFFKACLFLGSGSVSHAVHSFNMKTDMGGLRKHMPHTHRTFVMATIALMGLPPLAGFWSKDEILVGTGGWGLFGGTQANGAYTSMLVMGMIGAAVTAAYMIRVVYLTFYGEYRGHGRPHESGLRILLPLYVLAFFAVVAGFLNLPKGFQWLPESWHERFGHYVEPVAAYFPHIGHAKPSWSLALVSTVIALAGAGVSWHYYFRRVRHRSAVERMSLTELPDGPVSRGVVPRAVHTLLVNKYYFDHLYTGVIVRIVKGPLARLAYWFNQRVIDGVVDGTGRKSVVAGRVLYRYFDQGLLDNLIVDGSGRTSDSAGENLRRMQTGKVQQYAAVLFAVSAVIAGVFIMVLAW